MDGTQMKFSKADIHKHRVIDVCQTLSGFIKGTSDGISPEEFRELAQWLHWRVNIAWLDYPRHPQYDFAVRQLALATLSMCTDKLREP